MLRTFKVALGFLTIIRPNLDPYPSIPEIARSAWTFPLVGAAIGIILALCHAVFSLWFAAPVVALLVLAAWIIATGGLHLDGWSDCWDALACAVTPERRNQIMKDSRIGTFGALALFVLVGLKASAICFAGGLVYLFAAPVVGRGIMVVASYGAPYRDEGIGSEFMPNLTGDSVKIAAGIALVAAAFAGASGLLGLIAAFAAAKWFRRFAENRLGTINGDVLGAICELSETIFLIIAVGKP
jgi:adenosylcobinamide-GDP ribazoletransferase